MYSTATTWGITGPQFLWGYAALCLAAAIAVLSQWRRAVGPPQALGHELPDLGVYELATLGDGPRLAITSAAAQLHRDGVIRPGLRDGGLEAAGELQPDADAVERAVFEVVRAEPGITAEIMRDRVQRSEAVRSMTDDLTRDGLLVADASATALARLVALLGGLLALLGILRIGTAAIAGQPVGWLLLMVALVVIAAVWLVAHLPVATARGRAALQRWRDAHDDLRRNPIGGECALAAALFAVLWLAAPDIASALGVEREAGERAGGGAGGCGSGCGGCGGCGG